ncbi:MAG: thrombospondin type 3 repeat-containing protein [Akkermansiaceae bacterium]
MSTQFQSIKATILALLAASSALQAVPVITSITTTDNEVTLIVQDDGTFQQFELQASLNLEAGTWGPIQDIASIPLGQNRYRLVVPRSAANKEFYRVIGRFLGSELDLDGDGLDNDRETNILGTDPNRFDTDSDGFSDATEVALGTDPLDLNSFPELAGLPAIDFEEPISSTEEGNGTHSITLKATQPFTGQVYLSVNERSSAVQGEDYANVPTSVMMSGDTLTFEINILDDLNIRPSRQLILDLSTNPPGGAYRAGGSVTHTINIADNDAYWFGTLRDNLTERTFRLCVVQNATTTQASFVSGQSDGLPTPDGGASSLSTGLIPDKDLDGETQEIWPVDAITFQLEPENFSLSITRLPSLNNGIITERLVRSLTLNANPATVPGQSVRNLSILGSYTEVISHADNPEETTYLNRILNGTFSLIREVAAAPAVNSPYDPTDD